MGQIATTGTKGQIVIPSEIRRRIGMEAGQRVDVSLEGDRVILRPIPKDLVKVMTGCLRGKSSLTADLIREHQREIRRDEKGRL